MDYIEGTDAARLVRDRYPHGMPTRDVCKIVSAIAELLTTPTNATCCTETSSRRISCSPIRAPVNAGFCWPTSVLHALPMIAT